MSDDKPYACCTAAPIGFIVACRGKFSRSAASPLRVYASVDQAKSVIPVWLDVIYQQLAVKERKSCSKVNNYEQ
ncbi:MAG: hypothetical protein KME49_18720 [Brasilonema octagenarum HA4186-MV1]|jgi:hypothetical protein|nr:hypothetical protein [Brasilonema octagenarum HA4186-MV1]